MTGTEIVMSAFIILGTFFILAGSIGVIRLPDVYCRMHAATKSITLGVASVMIAAIVYFFVYYGYGFSGKNILAVIFLIITAPAAAHMISRAAYHIGVPIWEGSVTDEFKEKCEYIKAEAADE